MTTEKMAEVQKTVETLAVREYMTGLLHDVSRLKRRAPNATGLHPALDEVARVIREQFPLDP
jgi:hypothetical protein